MVIFSHGIGAGYGAEVLLFCGGFIVLPAVVLLCMVAWVADAPWAAWTAFAVAGLSCMVALLNVSGYTPSDNWEVTDEQTIGRRQAEFYILLTLTTGIVLVAIGMRRVVRRLWPQRVLPTRQMTVAERLVVIEQMVSRGMASEEEAAKIRRRLVAKGAEADPSS